MATVAKLPSEARVAFAKVNEWLPKQNFKNIDELQYHSSPELVEICKTLLEYLPESSKEFFDPEAHDTRITAIRVQKNSVVPVKAGSHALLIPVAIDDGAKIDGRELHELEYIQLSGEVEAEPGFSAVLLLSR